MVGAHANGVVISAGRQDFFISEDSCDFAGSIPGNAEVINSPYHCRCRLVDQPCLLIIFITLISERNVK